MRICPSCQSHFADDVDVCPDDGEALYEEGEEPARNPLLGERVLGERAQATPGERTSMIDLEAIEAKRAARRADVDGEAQDGGEPAAMVDAEQEHTPPPDGPIEADHEATGTLQKSRLGRRTKTRASRTGTGAALDNASVLDAADASRAIREATRSKIAQRTGTGVKGATGTGRGAVDATQASRTGITRRTQLGAAKKRPLSVATASIAALALLSALVGGIIVAAQLFAVLTVTTVPPGAEVRLDGVIIGASPLQKRIHIGSHVIELDLQDYEPFKEVVDVPSSGLPFLQPLQKKPPPPPPPPTAAQQAEELLRHATQLFEASDLEGAKNMLEEAKRLTPDNDGVLALLKKVDAEIQARADAFGRAASSANAAQRVSQSRALTQQGKQQYGKGDFSAAKDKLFAAIKLDGGYPEPHRLLGKVYNREHDDAKVRYHLERFLALGGADGDFKVREWLKTHPK